MLRIRRCEERILALFREGALRGTAHACIGQEAVAVGACSALTPADLITSNHRGHGHLLARGGEPARLLAELFGRETGYSLGRGGSQHLADFTIGFLGANGITAGGLPIAVGAALSLALRRAPAICLAFFGDGATAQGAFHEAMNLAALWRLPLVFLCENNHYAMGTHVRHTCPTATIAERAAAYGMPAQRVDGNDVLAVAEAVRQARQRAVAGDGPTLVEAVTYRLLGHSRSDPCLYRPRAEEREWAERDPLLRLRNLICHSLPDGEAHLKRITGEVEAEIEEAVRQARQAPILPAARAADGVYPPVPAEPKAWPPAPAAETQPRECTYADALYLALSRALQDERVLILGEDVAAYGGAFRVTRDLHQRYGQARVRDTPISENTIVGAGVGLAMTGFRPVVEIMFMDFLLLAMDQLVNHAAKFAYLFGGQAKVPLTLRIPAGGRRGYGATHSQCLEAMLLSVPGLKIFCPATVQDAYNLLLAAVYDDAPTVVVEHKLLYGVKGYLDPGAAPLPAGKARIMRPGRDVTILTFSHMTLLALQAAEALAAEGIEAEVIDLRTLVPLDLETAANSVSRTQRVVIAEEGVGRGGVGAEIAAALQDICSAIWMRLWRG